MRDAFLFKTGGGKRTEGDDAVTARYFQNGHPSSKKPDIIPTLTNPCPLEVKDKFHLAKTGATNRIIYLIILSNKAACKYPVKHQNLQ